ncbi:unnamed protein product, partial [Pocillopora meandrina]
MVGLAVGCLTYTSSGESDFSEDENGERHLTRYLVKKSPVKRSRQSKVKKALDDVYIKSLHPRARLNLVTRQTHERLSSRYRPIKALEWASHNNGRLIPRHPSFNINNFPTIRNLTPSTGTTSPTIAAPSVQRHPQNNIWFPPPPRDTSSSSDDPIPDRHPAHHPSTNTSPTTMAASFLGTRNFPTIRNLTPSTGTTSPTIAAPSVQRHPQNNIWFPPPHGTHYPVVTIPSPSALPSTASPSSMPSASLTPKTSKKKHTNSKKRTV